MPSSGPITITVADLSQPADQAATLELLDAYSMDPMGDGKPLSETARRDLIPGLRAHPTTVILIAWLGANPAGIAICFLGFSTFAARPLLNVHDYCVLPGCRGTGIGRQLMAAVEERARALGCCRITLEVQENNYHARRIYAAAGFTQAVHVAEAGGALFLSKPL
jgi:ribosomal protein S18 acetylase RimI-like enzyme